MEPRGRVANSATRVHLTRASTWEQACKRYDEAKRSPGRRIGDAVGQTMVEPIGPSAPLSASDHPPEASQDTSAADHPADRPNPTNRTVDAAASHSSERALEDNAAALAPPVDVTHTTPCDRNQAELSNVRHGRGGSLPPVAGSSASSQRPYARGPTPAPIP